MLAIHPNRRSRKADRRDHTISFHSHGRTEADASSNRLLSISGNPCLANLLKLREQSFTICNRVIRTWSKAVYLQHPICEPAFLKGRDRFSHRRAMWRKHAANLVRHANPVKGLQTIKPV